MKNENASKIMVKSGKHITDISTKTLTPIYNIEYVCTFEEWDDSISVYIFFADNELKKQALSSGVVDMLKEKYICYLKTHNYPFDKFPKVFFEIDSHENVLKNYEGSYFYRLR